MSRPVIDGLDVLRRCESTGLDPERLLPPLSSLLPTGTERRVLIGASSYGESGCGALALRVRLAGAVAGEPDEAGRDEALSRPGRFDLRQHLDALDEAMREDSTTRVVADANARRLAHHDVGGRG